MAMQLRDYQQEAELYKLPETRERALFLNSKFYFSGKKCKKDHLSAYYTSSGNCIKCIEERRSVVFTNYRGKSSIRSNENQELAEIAWNKGESSYVSLSKCKKGHYVRYVTTNNCIECDKITQLKRKKQNRWAAIKKKYGISESDFNNLINKQNNKCAICNTELTDKNQHVDHCHKTNKVRNILCVKCNQGIGSFDENIEKLANAIKYIELHNA